MTYWSRSSGLTIASPHVIGTCCGPGEGSFAVVHTCPAPAMLKRMISPYGAGAPSITGWLEIASLGTTNVYGPLGRYGVLPVPAWKTAASSAGVMTGDVGAPASSPAPPSSAPPASPPASGGGGRCKPP